MKVTSAQASKILKKLNEQHSALLSHEEYTRTFNAATGEDPETLRPEYDFASVQEELAELEQKIRKVKHALNVFNSTQEVPGYGFTIDEMLVYLPQLTKRVAKLSYMKQMLPKSRAAASYGDSRNIIDYIYTNYDIKQAEKAYNDAADELAKAQNALDYVNVTAEFEIDIDF